MIKQTISYIIAILVVLLCGNSAYAENMDIEWSITLLEIKDTASVPDSVAEPMALQCAILVKAIGMNIDQYRIYERGDEEIP